MKKHLILHVFALLLFSPWGFADAPRDFPIPPQQSAPWKLPDKVPDPQGELKAAVDTMFKLGLADPRGCPYHHVTVKEAGKLHDARAWVLPATQGDTIRYAIGWNGLIYPVEKVGKEADLAVDVKILISGDHFQDMPFSNYRDESSEQILSEYAATPRMMRDWAAPYLLLRLGESVQVYDDVTGIPADDFDPFAIPPVQPKHLEYPSSLFLDSDHERLVQCARLIRGDGVAAFIEKNDRLAAARVQAFDRVSAEVERKLLQEERAKRSNFSFNASWRSLLADAQRRLEPAKAVGDSEIAKAIATWDEVENWDEKSPPASFEKVVAAGPAAITPLLECLEHDPRWTRGSRVEEGSDDDKRVHYNFPRVRDLAFHALNRILRFTVVWVPANSESFDDTWSEEGVAKMKAFHNEYGNACGGELWFRILADEDAEIEDQLQAAKYIVRPVSFGEYGLGDDDYHLFYDPNVRNRFLEPIRSIEGGQLLLRRDPSVADLLKRAWKRSHLLIDQSVADGAPEEVFPVGCGGGSDVRTLALRYQPHQFVVLLEQWQHGNQEVLKEHYDRLATSLANIRKNTKSSDYVVSMLCEETLILRFWAEDKSAMHDYEQLVRAARSPQDVPINVMFAVPNESGMDQLAQAAILGNTALLSLVNKTWEEYDSRESLIRGNLYDDTPSPLLILPSFRRALIEALQTKTKQGTLLVKQSGCSVKFDADASKPGSSTSDEATLPGTGQEVRLCDVIADILTPDRGPAVWVSPRFHLADPLPERDRAIAEWIKVLSEPGR